MRILAKAMILSAFIIPLTTGCAHVSEFLSSVIPTIEAKAGGQGIGLSIESDLGVKLFCIKEEGSVKGFLDKIPVIGSVVVEVVGTCPLEEVDEVPAADPVE